MILKAKHNFFIYNFFRFYTLIAIKSKFKNFNIIGKIQNKNLPLLLVSNHSTWWDGFWIMYLNLKLFKRRFYFMMKESQLKKFWFFNYSGGFSINNNNKSLFESLNYSANIVSNTSNLLLIFPQGKLNSIYNNNIHFQKGIEKILQKTKNKVQIVFVANLVEFFNFSKPTVFQYIKEYEYEKFNFIDFCNQYQEFFNNCIYQQSKIHV